MTNSIRKASISTFDNIPLQYKGSKYVHNIQGILLNQFQFLVKINA